MFNTANDEVRSISAAVFCSLISVVLMVLVTAQPLAA